jgi:hypothetical protein
VQSPFGCQCLSVGGRGCAAHKHKNMRMFWPFFVGLIDVPMELCRLIGNLGRVHSELKPITHREEGN